MFESLVHKDVTDGAYLLSVWSPEAKSVNYVKKPFWVNNTCGLMEWKSIKLLLTLNVIKGCYTLKRKRCQAMWLKLSFDDF